MRRLLLLAMVTACGLEESGLLETHDAGSDVGGPDVMSDVAATDVTPPTDTGTDVDVQDASADVVTIDANDAAADAGNDAEPILTISGGTYQLLALDSGVCSMSSSLAASFGITNDRDASIDLDWVNYQCGEQSYGTIAPLANQNQGTFVTHVWRVRNHADSAFLGQFVLSSSNTFTVTVH